MHFISNPSIDDIKTFIESNPIGLKKFRYFNKRDFNVIENHIKTLILVDKEKFLGYSHLDVEGDNVWFGIIICDECVGKGYGSYLIKETLSDFNDEVKLSVDKDNLRAINLYLKNGFEILEEFNDYILMIKKKQCKNTLIK